MESKVVAVIDHIRGDTFFWKLTIDGVDQLLQVDSQVRTKEGGELLSNVSVDQREDFIYELIIENTKEWPVGEVHMDIQLTMDVDGHEVIQSSGIIQINVQKDVTKDVG